MKRIKADHDRRLAIAGVPGLVQRPVDIDRTQTGFANLRSLRIYRFDAGCEINGHAEEDEVFVVAMAGSVELTVSGDGSGEESRTFTLSAADGAHTDPCVAYLPPDSAYRLIPQTDADIAYARATPSRGYPAKVFAANGLTNAAGVTVLLEEKSYLQRLRLRLVQINTEQDAVDFTPIQEPETMCEALVHVRTSPTHAVTGITTSADSPMELQSWDTAAIYPGDGPVLRISQGSSALILVVLAV